MRLLRNLARRKLRTALTIAGITIGIWALVVFSSMANKINSLVAGGSEYFENKILVTDATGGGFAALPISAEAVDQIAALDGVGAAVPQVSFFADEELSGGFGQPDQVEGGVAGADGGRETFVLRPIQGRLLTPEDEGADVALVGSDLARERGAVVGQPLDVRGRTFEVVGILEPTLTAPDATIYIPLQAAQEMFYEQVPPVVRENSQPADLVSQVVVYPDAGVDIAGLAERIETTVDNSATLTGEQFDELVGGSVAIFNAIIIGVALISLIVGGLSVINTMAMSVAERTREIGIKRAIGGSRRRIIRELMVEAGVIGFIGGLIGLVLGAVVVVLANEAGRSSGTILFDLTPGTALFAVAFSTILGILAGVLPAWNAARLDPVAALRYE
jgi:putative ABC transport system permease protein